MPEQSHLHWKWSLPAKLCAWKTTGFTCICGKNAQVLRICDTATISSRLCGYHSSSKPMSFRSSGNVMLVTMATNDENNYPGFRAQVSQVRRGSPGKTSVFSEWWMKLTRIPLLFTVHVWMFLQPPCVEASCQVITGGSLHPIFQITILLELPVIGQSR